MIIAGASGFALEVFNILIENKINSNDIYFFEDIQSFYDKINKNKIIRTNADLESIILKSGSNDVYIGVGNPNSRELFYNKFSQLKCNIKTLISDHSFICDTQLNIEQGCTIMNNTTISCGVNIGMGCLINSNSYIGHDTTIGNFCAIAPGSSIGGGCKIGDKLSMGLNACILPNIVVGNNVTIGAGSVVNKNIPDSVTVVGIPCRIVN